MIVANDNGVVVLLDDPFDAALPLFVMEGTVQGRVVGLLDTGRL
jgi:hypothetical protein